MSREHPARNLFAESVLATIEVECSHEGCSKMIAVGSKAQHEEECEYKVVLCKFHLLGCSWTGLKSQVAAHKKECSIKQMSPRRILKLVQEKEEAKKLEAANSRSNFEKGGRKVLDLLSARVHDIVVRDVLLEKDEICDEVCSKTFMALGLAWEVIMTKNPKNPNQAAVEIRMVSSLRKKLRVSFFIVKGPYVSFDIAPSVHNAEFDKDDYHYTRDSAHSQLCPLNVDEETSRKLLEEESIHLRIGFVDRSRGISSRFSNHHCDEESSSNDDETESGSLEDDYHTVYSPNRSVDDMTDSEDDIDYYYSPSDSTEVSLLFR